MGAPLPIRDDIAVAQLLLNCRQITPSLLSSDLAVTDLEDLEKPEAPPPSRKLPLRVAVSLDTTAAACLGSISRCAASGRRGASSRRTCRRRW